MFDEEVDEKDVEFSDDEKEMQFKRQKKRKMSKRNEKPLSGNNIDYVIPPERNGSSFLSRSVKSDSPSHKQSNLYSSRNHQSNFSESSVFNQSITTNLNQIVASTVDQTVATKKDDSLHQISPMNSTDPLIQQHWASMSRFEQLDYLLSRQAKNTTVSPNEISFPNENPLNKGNI